MTLMMRIVDDGLSNLDPRRATYVALGYTEAQIEGAFEVATRLLTLQKHTDKKDQFGRLGLCLAKAVGRMLRRFRLIAPNTSWTLPQYAAYFRTVRVNAERESRRRVDPSKQDSIAYESERMNRRAAMDGYAEIIKRIPSELFVKIRDPDGPYRLVKLHIFEDESINALSKKLGKSRYEVDKLLAKELDDLADEIEPYT